MRKILAALAISAVAALGATSALAAGSDEGQGASSTTGETCVTVVDVPEQTIHHDAVTHEVTIIDVEAVAGFWANFAPNDNHGPFEGVPSYPTDPAGVWIVHTEGGPGQDESGVFQIGNGNGDWFYRQQAVAEVSHTETVVDVEAYDETIPAVTHEECTSEPGVVLVCQNGEVVEAPEGTEDDGTCVATGPKPDNPPVKVVPVKPATPTGSVLPDTE